MTILSRRHHRGGTARSNQLGTRTLAEAAVGEVDDMRHFRIDSFSHAEIERLAAAFASAQPFPHLVIPDVLRAPPEEILASFPPLESPLWRELSEAYQPGKMTLSNIARIPEPLASMLHELMQPATLELLERISGIKRLLPDPYLDGGGLHCSRSGGVMAPHTDVHINDRLGLYKRMIVLVYLNPGWQEADGGCLELFDESDVRTPVKTVVPRWGTMVIFRSDAHSVHGFTQPIVATGGRARRALASYYYTAADAPEYAGNELTHWRQDDAYWARDGASLLMRHARLGMYRALRLGSKTLAYLAYRASPRATDTMR
jgi:Rps23 Pro-64 3,4-dihydroxylase Tpa1-like proline 4-hydroxylase